MVKGYQEVEPCSSNKGHKAFSRMWLSENSKLMKAIHSYDGKRTDRRIFIVISRIIYLKWLRCSFIKNDFKKLIKTGINVMTNVNFCLQFLLPRIISQWEISTTNNAEIGIELNKTFMILLHSCYPCSF